jgi:hypothetical protein
MGRPEYSQVYCAAAGSVPWIASSPCGFWRKHCSAIVRQSRYDQHFVMGKAKLELEAQDD